MGRRRALDRDALLDAAETVVRRDGAARLTLDAVADEAGISKASVLYDCKSKSGLVRAIVERRLDEARARGAQAREEASGADDPAFCARLALAREAISDEDREIIFALHTALAQDPGQLDPIRRLIAAWLDDLERTSPAPRGSLLAFLALEGLEALERYDLHSFTPDRRRRILGDIEWLSAQTPALEPACRCGERAEGPTE